MDANARESRVRRDRRGLALCGTLLGLVLATISWLPPINRVATPLFLLLAFPPFAVSAGLAIRLGWERTRWLILGGALSFRVLLLFAPFTLSDDVYRYWWEGRVQNAGFNPFVHAPDSPALAHLREANWAHVAHKEVPTIYPPLTLLVFRAVAAIRAGPWAFKLAFAACDLAALGLIVRLLRDRGRDPGLAILWAWNPLIVVEFAGNGHEMSLAIAWFLFGLRWLPAAGAPNGGEPSPGKPQSSPTAGQGMSSRQFLASGLSRPGLPGLLAGACFAGAVLAHLLALPLVIAVALSQHCRSWRFWVPFVLVVAAGFALYADAGRQLFLGAAHFAGRWRWNGSVFEVLARVLGEGQPRELVPGLWLTFAPAKLLLLLLLLLVLAVVALRRPPAARAALIAGVALLLLSPTVHPWYVTWLVALGAVASLSRTRDGLVLAALAWSGTVIFSYLPVADELSRTALQIAEYLPVYLLLLWQLRGPVDRPSNVYMV